MSLINSEDNKAILWNILYKNGIFNNIPNNKVNDIKSIFEDTINSFINSLKNVNIENYNITEINKSILTKINTKILIYKKHLNFDNNELNMKTKTLMQSEKVLIFDKDLQKQKDSIQELTLKKPESIDFSDKSLNNTNDDSPLSDGDMNRMLQQMQKNRNMLPEAENIIKEKEEIVSNSSEEIDKHKITSINDLLNLKESNNTNNINNEIIEDKLNVINIDDFNKRNSKIEEKNINKFINSEYEDEKNINLNNKFRILEDKIDKLLKNQQLIMNKLEINI